MLIWQKKATYDNRKSHFLQNLTMSESLKLQLYLFTIKKQTLKNHILTKKAK